MIFLDGRALTLESLVAIADAGAPAGLAPDAARRVTAARAVDLARRVTGVEILCACQALDLLAPLTRSAPLARVHARVREIVPTHGTDRVQSGDIEAIAEMNASGAVQHACAMEVKQKLGIDNVRVRS